MNHTTRSCSNHIKICLWMAGNVVCLCAAGGKDLRTLSTSNT